MLIGMKAPNNLGKRYVNEFNSIYPNLAKIYKVSFYPFFLKDVVLVPSLNQNDMIHPNKKGVKGLIAGINLPKITVYGPNLSKNFSTLLMAFCRF